MHYRLRDIILSAISIIFLSPIFIVISIILFFTGEREIFYRQTRVGYKRKFFNVLKFATMLKDSPNMGAGTLTLKDDPRVLPIGKMLRKTKLNELPQLFNILKGDMSIVGPRPLVPLGEELYEASISNKLRSVRPGLTGVGSIFLRDEEAIYANRVNAAEFYKNVIIPYKSQLEIWYIENRSFALDLKIILLTVLVVLQPKLEVSNFFRNLPEKPDGMRIDD